MDFYSCSLCGARFPSLQALGGHKSVHRNKSRKNGNSEPATQPLPKRPRPDLVATPFTPLLNRIAPLPDTTFPTSLWDPSVLPRVGPSACTPPPSLTSALLASFMEHSALPLPLSQSPSRWPFLFSASPLPGLPHSPGEIPGLPGIGPCDPWSGLRPREGPSPQACFSTSGEPDARPPATPENPGETARRLLGTRRRSKRHLFAAAPEKTTSSGNPGSATSGKSPLGSRLSSEKAGAARAQVLEPQIPTQGSGLGVSSSRPGKHLAQEPLAEETGVGNGNPELSIPGHAPACSFSQSSGGMLLAVAGLEGSSLLAGLGGSGFMEAGALPGLASASSSPRSGSSASADEASFRGSEIPGERCSMAVGVGCLGRTESVAMSKGVAGSQLGFEDFGVGGDNFEFEGDMRLPLTPPQGWLKDVAAVGPRSLVREVLPVASDTISCRAGVDAEVLDGGSLPGPYSRPAETVQLISWEDAPLDLTLRLGF